MTIAICSELHYRFAEPTDILLQIEAAMIPEQVVNAPHIDLSPTEHFARVPGEDMIGERIFMRVEGDFTARYTASVDTSRVVPDLAPLAIVPPHLLPGGTVHYLFESRYCPAQEFYNFVTDNFDAAQGGAKVLAMRDWIAENIQYLSGSSDASTTTRDSFIERRGVCRDFAHMLVSFARAATIPARVASVYAPGVEPPDFHLVAELFLDNAWHLVDATGMAQPADMVKIGVGRDAADVSFLTAFGAAEMVSQSVAVDFRN